MEPLAKTAYDAYRRAKAHAVARRMEENDNPTPEWEDLDTVEKEAWDAAAQTVAGSA